MRIGFSPSLSDKDLKEIEERKDKLADMIIRDNGYYASPREAEEMALRDRVSIDELRRIVIDIDELLDQIRIMKRYISINLR